MLRDKCNHDCTQLGRLFVSRNCCLITKFQNFAGAYTNIRTSVFDKKKAALVALGSLAEHAPVAFYPHLPLALETLTQQVRYYITRVSCAVRRRGFSTKLINLFQAQVFSLQVMMRERGEWTCCCAIVEVSGSVDWTRNAVMTVVPSLAPSSPVHSFWVGLHTTPCPQANRDRPCVA